MFVKVTQDSKESSKVSGEDCRQIRREWFADVPDGTNLDSLTIEALDAMAEEAGVEWEWFYRRPSGPSPGAEIDTETQELDPDNLEPHHQELWDLQQMKFPWEPIADEKEGDIIKLPVTQKARTVEELEQALINSQCNDRFSSNQELFAEMARVAHIYSVHGGSWLEDAIGFLDEENTAVIEEFALKHQADGQRQR